MKRRFLSNIICISFLAIAGVALFSSCNDDDTVKGYNGPRITIIQENFGSQTRSGESPIIHQETVDLGDGIFMDVTLQEDFGPVVEVSAKTRADEGYIDISAGVYTIIGYYLDGRYAGENKGTVSYGTDGVGVFTPDPSDTFKFHDGEYNFICVKNVALSDTRDAAFVTRGTAGSDAALISEVAEGTIKGSINEGQLDIQFTMRHKESGIRFSFNSQGGFVGAAAEVTSITDKPSKHKYNLPAIALDENDIEMASIGTVQFKVIGESQVISDYQYYLPGTNASDIEIKFVDGQVWGKELKSIKPIVLDQLTEKLKANTRYTATINFRDGLPAFDGIIAYDPVTKMLTLNGGSTPGARTVFFKGGSVVANGGKYTAWSSREIVYNPTNPASSFNEWSSILNETTTYTHSFDNVIIGKGDPCRLIGIAADDITIDNYDNKEWRLPTQDEYEGAVQSWFTAEDAKIKGEGLGNGSINYPGCHVNIGGESIYQPAIGNRSNEGVLEAQSQYMRYWTSTFIETGNFVALTADASNRALGGVDASNGYTVRCVRQEVVLPPGTGGTDKVPAFDYIIAIGSDGKLTLEGSKDENARTVYFKFGSTIAQSTVSGEWNSDGVAYNPTDCPNTDYNLWDAIPYGNATHTYDNVKAGMGDPCRLVGIDKDKITMSYFDNRTWRLPTYDENTKATVISPAYGVTVSGNYVGKFIKMIEDDGASGLFYPASGRRDMTTGNYEGQKYRGYYWTSTPWGTNENKENAYSLYFDNNSSGVNKEGYNEMKYGFAVRCVPQTP